MSIVNRIVSHTVVVTSLAVIVTAALIGTMSYMVSGSALKQQAVERIISLRDTQKRQVENYFDLIKKQITVYSHDRMIIDAMHDLKKSFIDYRSELKDLNDKKFKASVVNHYLTSYNQEYIKYNGQVDIESKKMLNVLDKTSFALQYHYILKNPYPPGQKNRMQKSRNHTTYDKKHAFYHSYIKDFKDKFNYYDIFLVDNISGDIVYSVEKELDFTTSLLSGPYSTTLIGQVFRKANAAKQNTFVAISDYEAYPPSYNQQAAFIASPIFDGKKKIGVLIFQIPIKVLNNLMTYNNAWEEVGLGKTGETYLVGKDHKMRSLSRFLIENKEVYLKEIAQTGTDQHHIDLINLRNSSIGLQQVNTTSVKKALTGESGYETIKDYRKKSVLSAYTPLEIPGLQWALISEIDSDEAFYLRSKVASRIFWGALIILVVLVLFSVNISVKIAKTIIEPLTTFSTLITDLADSKDLTKRFNIDTDDELTTIAKSLNHMLDQFQNYFQQTLSSSHDMKNVAEKLIDAADKDTSDFSTDDNSLDIKETSEDISELSDKLEQLSKQFKIFEEESDKENNW